MNQEDQKYKIIDTHIHWVDFLQNTDGLWELLKNMDSLSLDKAVIFGLPVKKKWAYHDQKQPSYYLDGYSTCFYYSLTDELLAQAYLALPSDQQKRLSPLICGFNPTDMSSIDYLEMMYEKYPIWKGVGELLLRHDELSTLTNDELPRINHPALRPILDFCQRKKLPVLIHHNSSSIGYENDFVYLHEMKEVLEQYPELKLIWAHCGASRRTMNGQFHRMIGDLMRENTNVFADISWIVYDEEVCYSGEPRMEWIEVLQEFPDRFMIGSDVFGHFEDIKTKLDRYHVLLDRLDPAAAQKLAWQNGAKMFFGD